MPENIQILTEKMSELNNLLHTVINEYRPVSSYETIKNEISRVVCDAFLIPQDELFNGTSKGERTDAVAVACVCFKHFLNMSHNQLINQFHKSDKSSISGYIKKLKSLNPKVPQDKALIDKIRIIKLTLEKNITK